MSTGVLTSEQYERMATAILCRGTRKMADIAREFEVSREYVRQVNGKLGLAPGRQVTRERKQKTKEQRDNFLSNCLQRLKEKYKSEYTAYKNAKQRCKNPKNPKYKDYGLRGILFNFKDFKEFLDDIGPKPWVGLTLDRIENEGHYEEGNVRWATQKQQCDPGQRRKRHTNPKVK